MRSNSLHSSKHPPGFVLVFRRCVMPELPTDNGREQARGVSRRDATSVLSRGKKCQTTRGRVTNGRRIDGLPIQSLQSGLSNKVDGFNMPE